MLKKEQEYLPAYMRFYKWAYVWKFSTKFLDNHFLVWIVLLGQTGILRKKLFEKINDNDKVLVVANVYGNILTKLAKKLTPNGSLTILDIVKQQTINCQKKFKKFKNTSTFHGNAMKIDTYDNLKNMNVIVSFFLLHELPDKYKTVAINAYLNYLSNNSNSKIIIIDYSNPRSRLLRYFIKNISFKLLDPFAHSLFEKEIKDFATNSKDFNWEKTYMSGKLYQRLVVTKKK